jgi:hypothetical protein
MKAIGIDSFEGLEVGVKEYFEIDSRADFAFGKPSDIDEFMQRCLGEFEIFTWESDQSKLAKGKSLVQVCKEHGYRVAHVLINVATFGICQRRRSYFFVAYKSGKNFNCSAPELPEFSPTVYDAIYHLKDSELIGAEKLSQEEQDCLPYLCHGWDLQTLVDYSCDDAPSKLRGSLIRPIKRINWTLSCPDTRSTILIHPDKNRTLTHEELKVLDDVYPPVAEWLALQVRYYLADSWGDKDYESTFDSKENKFIGRDCPAADEKVFDFTNYVQTKMRDHERFQLNRFNVDSSTGRRIRAWEDIAKSRQQRINI